MREDDIKARARHQIKDLAQYEARLRDIEKRYMENVPEKDIFGRAQKRQLKLVSLCFDMCIDTIVNDTNYFENDLIRKGILIKDGRAKREIRALDFYCGKTPDELSDKEKADIRKRMVDFLEKKCLIIFDGNVKDEARTLDKIRQSPSKNLHSVKDINRLTIASYDLPLLERYADNLGASLKDEELCAKHVWEWKPHGLLSRTNIVIFDCVPTEVHLNEPRQLLLGNALTHAVYEAFRVPEQKSQEGAEKFNQLFKELPNKTKASVERDKVKFTGSEYKILTDQQVTLSKIVLKNADLGNALKYDCLVNFNRAAHEKFFDISSKEWKTTYSNSREIANYLDAHPELYDDESEKIYNNEERLYPPKSNRPDMRNSKTHVKPRGMDIK